MTNFRTPLKLLAQTVGATSFLLLIGTTQPSHAGEITALTWSMGIASVGADIIHVPVAPNNEHAVGPSPNALLVTQKAYMSIGPVDLVFTVIPSGGTTEYVMNEGVYNGTGIPWTGYRLELGTGMGGAFTPSPSGDNLDFDAPSFDSNTDFSAYFPTWVETEDVITASGGIFPNFGFTTPLFRFSVDVPDGIPSFTIRQIPIGIPEPSTALLLTIGIGFTWLKRAARPR